MYFIWKNKKKIRGEIITVLTIVLMFIITISASISSIITKNKQTISSRASTDDPCMVCVASSCAKVASPPDCNGLFDQCGSDADCGGGPPPQNYYCGDQNCNNSETCANCPEDCGTCEPQPIVQVNQPPQDSYCGDGRCDVDENSASCEKDCSKVQQCAGRNESVEDTLLPCCQGLVYKDGLCLDPAVAAGGPTDTAAPLPYIAPFTYSGPSSLQVNYPSSAPIPVQTTQNNLNQETTCNLGSCCGSASVCIADKWTKKTSCLSCPSGRVCVEGKGCDDPGLLQTVGVNECRVDGGCCGEGGVCQSTGLFGLGGLKCNSCTGSNVCRPGQGCVDINKTLLSSSQPSGCSSPGSAEFRDGKCFVCFTATAQEKNGELIATDNSLCARYEKGETITSGDIITKATSSDDRYKLRNKAYSDYVRSDASITDKVTTLAMSGADGILYYTVGQLPKIFGGEGTGFGEYYQAQANIESVLASQGKSYGNQVNIGPVSIKVADPQQVLSTTLGGGLEASYRYSIIPGLIDTGISALGGGKPIESLVESANDSLLTMGWGENKEIKDSVKKTQQSGLLATDFVGIMVPAGKGINAIGTFGENRLAAVALRIEEAGQGGLRALPFELGSKAYGTIAKVGKGLETISPEAWDFAKVPVLNKIPIVKDISPVRFIKESPVSTSLEVAQKSLGETNVA